MGDTLESLRAEIARLKVCIDALSRVHKRRAISVEATPGHAGGKGFRLVVTFPHGDAERERLLCEAVGREFARQLCECAGVGPEAVGLTPEEGDRG